MERFYNKARPAAQKQPLTDASSKANAYSSTPSRYHKKIPPPIVTSSAARSSRSEPMQPPKPAPGNKRISAIAAEEIRDPKRDSAISNASTNASNGGRRRKTHIGPWQLGKTIGRGGCSRVRAVRHSYTGQYGAAKIISKATAEKIRALSLANLISSAEEQGEYANGKVMPFGLEREIVIMKLLEHRNIVRLYDVWENRNELYLVMEYVQGGELFHYIDERGGLDEPEVVYLFCQIIAALLYCHRIHIYHRDLKPENILLDKGTFEIKLVDFGMAALQPEGRYLSTPCGSPHYAAPEVIRSKAYDGGKADVWSCGVILYVMLTGSPPFNYSSDSKQLHVLFKAIMAANYVMPDFISKEAQDLIARILVPDPAGRISIESIWDHPFLHKYDAQFGYEKSSLEHWIGPRPKIEDWKTLTRQTIDREVLRNMRTLWHSEKEEVLIQRLLGIEPNHEKYFYSALLKHREEHLENYAGGLGGVGYSASDYQHTQSAVDPNLLLPSGNSHKRSQSQFSILNNEHLYSKHSFYEPPPSSEASYDPFRASREAIVQGNGSYLNVTVHRPGSAGRRSLRPGSVQGQRQNSSLRVEMLKKSKRLSSGYTHSKPSTGPGSSIAYRRSMSRGSMTSSVWPSSPPIIVRPGNSYKRNVSFSHLRKSSTASRPTSEGPQYTPEQRSFLRRPQRDSLSTVGTRAHAPVQSLRDPEAACKTQQNPGHVMRIRNHPTPSHYIEKEARKVSVELEKVCEEAFFRSSYGSSVRTSATTDKGPFEYDTPPSSVSNRGSGTRYGQTVATPTDGKDRPLPPLPQETPNTFIAREVMEARQRIAARYAAEGGSAAVNFNEVIATLDNLLQPTAAGSSQRAVSAPYDKSPECASYLPAISEEGKYSDGRYYRAVTDPASRKPMQPRRCTDQDATIRLVDPSSPAAVPPLNIRKRSGASTIADQPTTPKASNLRLLPNGPPFPVPVANTKARRNTALWDGGDTDLTRSGTMSDNDEDNARTLTKKKSMSWFRRNNKDDEDTTVRAKIPEQWRDLDDRIKNPAATGAKPATDNGNSHESFTARKTSENERTNIAKKSLLRFFGRGKKEDDSYIDRRLELGSLADTSTISLTSAFDMDAFDTAAAGAPPIDYTAQSNWLARFLHIKPASKTLCLQVGRGRARQEIVRLLRDWKKYGVRDIVYDRVTNVIQARVDKQNHLKIRPVTLICELFTILEHGRRANLCLARFTQTRGAASSFKKVLEVLEDVMNTRGFLVEDEERKGAMMDVLKIVAENARAQ